MNQIKIDYELMSSLDLTKLGLDFLARQTLRIKTRIRVFRLVKNSVNTKPTHSTMDWVLLFAV